MLKQDWFVLIGMWVLSAWYFDRKIEGITEMLIKIWGKLEDTFPSPPKPY